jgi:hypothetical protein
MIRTSWLVRLGVLLLATAASSCANVDLKTTLEVTDMHSGYYDGGNVDGKIRFQPSVTFRLHNKSGQSINTVQLMVSFWRAGTDGEWDSATVRGIGSESLAAGATTEPIVVRGHAAFTLEGPRAEFFTNSYFQDVTAKVFALRSGDIVPMGEFKLDRQTFAHDLIEKK